MASKSELRRLEHAERLSAEFQAMIRRFETQDDERRYWFEQLRHNQGGEHCAPSLDMLCRLLKDFDQVFDRLVSCEVRATQRTEAAEKQEACEDRPAGQAEQPPCTIKERP